MQIAMPLRLVALAASLPLFLQLGTPAHSAPAPTRFSVTVTGQGSDVILIPGLASSASVWNATVAGIKAGHRVHVVQVAGFAGTPVGGNAGGPVLLPLVAELHAYIEAQHLNGPAVIGHSFGGLVATELALDHPADVGRLMIVDSLPFFGMVTGPGKTVADLEPLARSMQARLAKGTQQDYAAAEPKAMARLIKSTGPAAQMAILAASSSDRNVVGQAMYDAFTTDLRPRLAGLKMPVTMVYPWDASTGVPQSAFDGLYIGAYASVPQAKVHRVDGSYHFIMLDQPDAFAREVSAFLAK